MTDVLIIFLIYFGLLFILAWYFSRKQKSLEAYFANKRGTSLWMLMFSTVATVVGAGGTVAIVGEVWETGISYGLALPASYIFGMIILGVVAKKIKEIGDRYKAYTIVDFFYHRFDKRNMYLTAILQILLLIIWIGIQAVAVANLASNLTKLEYNTALLLTAVITVVYTSIGGLKVDIVTDFIQFWIIMLVFGIASYYGLVDVGGFEGLRQGVPSEKWDPFAFGGVAWTVGIVLIGGFLFLANTSHWQRIFSADSISTARRSFFLAIPFVALISFIVLLIGVESIVLVKDVEAKEQVVFEFMKVVLPTHWVGVGYAAILAVIMSSIDSYLIGGSAIIYKVFLSKRSEDIKLARIVTMVFGALGFLIAYLLPDIVKLSLLLSYMALIFVPAILAGLYSRRVRAEASFWSILVPTVVLLIGYWFMYKYIFLLTTLLAILIVIFYPKEAKRS